MLDLELPAIPSSAARARRATVALEGDVHPEAIARLRVLLSEVVSAFALLQRGGAIHLRVEAEDGRVRGNVEGRASLNGRLLSGWARLLMERLSDGWGESPGEGAVWFEVAAQGQGASLRAAS
jgi:hypothetical protein